MITTKERIKLLCNKYKLSETNLSIKCGLSPSTLSKASRVDSIGIKAAKKISETFNVNFDWIFKGEGEPYYNESELANNKNQDMESGTRTIVMNLKLTKYDNNTPSSVLIENHTKFIGDALYIVESADVPKMYFISSTPFGNIKLENTAEEIEVSQEEFKKIKILGIVKEITKKIK